MKYLPLSIYLILPAAASVVAAHGDPLPDFYYDPADATVAVERFPGDDNYQADLVAAEESIWVAWLEFVPGLGDRLWVGERGEPWKRRTAVVDYGAHARPTLTVDAQGRLWLSYESSRNGQWDVYAVRLVDGQAAGEPMVVSDNPRVDINHVVAADEQGNLWFAWQTDRDGQYDIAVRRLTDSELDPVEIAGDDPRGQWRPAIACAGNRVHVAWDGYNGRDFDVCLRTRVGEDWGPVDKVAASTAFEGRVDLAVDLKNRLWLAWEEGAENWGKPYRGIDTLAIDDQHGPLHRFRRIRVAIQDQNGLALLADPLPMPSFRLAANRDPKEASVRQTGVFYERPQLAVDGRGLLWLAYRHYYTPWLGVEHRTHVEQGWGIYLRSYGEQGWSDLKRFDALQGDGLQRLQLAGLPDGIAALWTTGRTDRNPEVGKRGLAMATVAAETGPPAEVATSEMPIVDRRPTSLPATDRARFAVDGQSYQLCYGDLHRHTDLSLCRVPFDGTIEDAYRYAIEVARLDFLGITDHSRDLALGNALSQLWWRSQKEVTRHELPPTFVPMFAYERSHGNTADHNVISLRPDRLRPHTYPVPQFWKELDADDTITIPHQPIRRDTWAYQDDQLRPLVEMYQGCRDDSIEDHVHQGLGKGFHLGFIASSDHLSTSASYACVWAEQLTREAIFAALKARRTYAATARIGMWVRSGAYAMGARAPAEELGPLELHAAGTAPIAKIDVVVDGQVFETFEPGLNDVYLRVDVPLSPGQYVYFHLVQNDGNHAWSSPIWVEQGNAREGRRPEAAND